MYYIEFTAGKDKGKWVDVNTRGNTTPMHFHEKINADSECELLNRQYNNEGFCFTVIPSAAPSVA